MVYVPDATAGDRELWKFSEGFYIKQPGDRWAERNNAGEVTFRFVETKRTDEFVELFDKNRNATIRLRLKMWMINQGDGKFEKLYEGGWADK